MLIRPERRDLRVIGFYLGKVASGLSLVMAAPGLLAVVLTEWNAAAALLAGAGVALVVGQFMEWRLATRVELTWAHGMVVVAMAWLLGSLLAAVPFFLSGHTSTFVGAWFEAMSGLTTSGLTVVEDLDHLAYALRLYRQLTQFVGGQGIVIVVLALFAAGGGAGTLYAAEAREERVVPSVRRTARFIFQIALVYLLVGTIAMTVAVWIAGIPGWLGLWHGLGLFFAGFDTGGFAPTTQSIGYYHSVSVEVVVMVLMVAGSLSFALHYRLFSGEHRELLRNLETRTLAVTMAAFTALAFYGLISSGAYTGLSGMFRKGFFTMLSAHSGTGYGVNSGTLYVTDWGALAPAAIVIVMTFGGMAGSTTGGVKGARLGLAAKGLAQDIRRVLLPDAALVVSTYHSGRRRILRTPELQSATVLVLLYFLTYLGGAVVALLYGEWDITETLFESVSAAANVGLSIGIVGPDMPLGLQVTYIAQMWLGRLEFMAVFALLGYALALARGRR
jgi:trk system potassium uptake protein